MKAQRLLITGATGMVGGEALRLALAHPEVGSVTSVGRRRVGFEHEKLREVLHEDFGDCAPLAEDLEDHDACLYCIGVYTGTVSDQRLREITVDHVQAFARTLHASSPDVAFCLLSGAGADQSGKSRQPFARYKGLVETALLEQGFKRLHLFRPAYIYPVKPRREPNVLYRISRALYPVLSPIIPGSVVPSDKLAQVMLDVALRGADDHPDPVLENREIRRRAGL